MKTIILFSCSLLISAFAAAQSTVPSKGDTASQTPYENKVDIQFRQQEDMVIVRHEDIPKALRTTLGQARYKGWEKSEIMRSSDGSIYELRMGKGEKAKRFRFDAEGKPVKE